VSVILALGRQKQVDAEFKTSLGYIVNPCLKKEANKQITASLNTTNLSRSQNTIFIVIFFIILSGLSPMYSLLKSRFGIGKIAY
jgi:hypothetical protein